MPYSQINLIIDILLIVVLSLSLLPKYPRFIIGLFLLYLVPWVLPLKPPGKNPVQAPVADTVSTPAKAPTGKAPSYDLSSQVMAFDPKASPQETLGKTEALYRQIFQVLGAATGTSPAPTTPQLQQLDALQAGTTSDRNNRLQSAMGDLSVTPDIAWFYLRMFWLTAAFTLWIQNRQIGLIALIPNLIPVFYLARALPLAYEKIKAHPLMKQATETVTDEHAGQALLGKYSIVFAAVLIALPTFLMVLLFWRQMRGVLGRRLKNFLNPDLYQVRFNGHLMDFKAEGKDLVVEGLRFNASRMVQDRKQPAVWRLGSGTVVEFVARAPG